MRVFLIGLIAVFAVGGNLSAANAIDVTSVQFTNRRLAGQSNSWLEAAVTIRAVTSNVEDVNVQLTLRFKGETRTPTLNNTRISTYSGRVRLAALDRSAIVRFYITPDVLRVRRLTQTPDAYVVSLSSSKGIEPFSRSQASANIPGNNPLIQTSSSSSTGGADSYTLLPQYNTPFYNLPETMRDLPSYIIP